VTSSRRAEADRLGALGITSDPTELVQMLQALAVRKPEAAPVQPASTVKVFLEYRRDDARAYAGRLADRLRSHFGSDAVFMDIEAIQLGVDFVESLVQALESSHVVLALIGPNWLSASDSQGRRRLDDPDDIVRVALRAAFERNIRVIPVLVDGASIPRQDELPADIAQLARINAIALDDARWDYDVERLIEAVERLGMMSVAQPTASANPA
jgi:hypothetical protein